MEGKKQEEEKKEERKITKGEKEAIVWGVAMVDFFRRIDAAIKPPTRIILTMVEAKGRVGIVLESIERIAIEEIKEEEQDKATYIM